MEELVTRVSHVAENRGVALMERLPPALRSIFDLERVVDDFILLCFLVGNDFLPHLPFAEIAAGGLRTLMELYHDFLIEESSASWWDGATTGGPWLSYQCGTIHWEALRRFLGRWAASKDEELNETLVDIYSKKRRGRRSRFTSPPRPRPTAAATTTVLQPPSADDQGQGSEAISVSGTEEAGAEGYLTAYDFANPPQTVDEMLQQYYRRKLGIATDTAEGMAALNDLIVNYMEGLQWNLSYYYRGVVSWAWFYRYHYPPYVRSIVDYAPLIKNELKITFDMGRLFAPFEQLLAVLPSASAALVPKTYRHLLESSESPLKKYYPDQFEVDMEGVTVPWGGVALIPFIEEERLLAAMRLAEAQKKLTSPELERNKVGTAICLSADVKETRRISSVLPRLFRDIDVCHVKETPSKHPEFLPPHQYFMNYVCPGHLKVIPGFPTLFTLEIQEASIGGGIVVFNGMQGRQPGVHLQLKSPLDPVFEPAETGGEDKQAREQSIAQILGHLKTLLSSDIVGINYPFLRPAKPVGLLVPWGYYRLYKSLTAETGMTLVTPYPPAPPNGFPQQQREAAEQQKLQYERMLHERLKSIEDRGVHLDESIGLREVLGRLYPSRAKQLFLGIPDDVDCPMSEVLVEAYLAETRYSHPGDTAAAPAAAPPVAGHSRRCSYRFAFKSTFHLLRLALPLPTPPALMAPPFQGPRSLQSLIGQRVICVNDISPLLGCCGHVESEPRQDAICTIQFPYARCEDLWELQSDVRSIVDEDTTNVMWYTLYQLSKAVNLPLPVVQRIAKSIVVQGPERRRIDIGMNLVFMERSASPQGPSRPFVLPGCAKLGRPSKKTQHEEILFSSVAVDMIRTYQMKWPSVFDAIQRHQTGPGTNRNSGVHQPSPVMPTSAAAGELAETTGMDGTIERAGGGGPLKAAHLFPGRQDPMWWLTELERWCKAQPFGAQRIAFGFGAESVSPEGVRKIQQRLDRYLTQRSGWDVRVRHGEDQLCFIDVDGHVPENVLAASSALYQASGEPRYLGALELGQRVVYAKRHGLIPFGSTGCVIATSVDPVSNEQLVEILTERPHVDCINLHGRCSIFRGCVVPASTLIPLRPLVLPWGLSSPTVEEFQSTMAPALWFLKFVRMVHLPLPTCRVVAVAPPAGVVVPSKHGGRLPRVFHKKKQQIQQQQDDVNAIAAALATEAPPAPTLPPNKSGMRGPVMIAKRDVQQQQQVHVRPSQSSSDEPHDPWLKKLIRGELARTPSHPTHQQKKPAVLTDPAIIQMSKARDVPQPTAPSPPQPSFASSRCPLPSMMIIGQRPMVAAAHQPPPSSESPDQASNYNHTGPKSPDIGAAGRPPRRGGRGRRGGGPTSTTATRHEGDGAGEVHQTLYVPK